MGQAMTTPHPPKKINKKPKKTALTIRKSGYGWISSKLNTSAPRKTGQIHKPDWEKIFLIHTPDDVRKRLLAVQKADVYTQVDGTDHRKGPQGWGTAGGDAPSPRHCSLRHRLVLHVRFLEISLPSRTKCYKLYEFSYGKGGILQKVKLQGCRRAVLLTVGKTDPRGQHD